MKRLVVLVFLTGLVFVTGCGRNGSKGIDGPDGDVYIAYSWLQLPQGITTNDPSMRSRIYNGSNYKTQPGTYTGSYTDWNGTVWPLDYTLTANKGSSGTEGEKGGFFWTNGQNGEDGQKGKTRYYTLYLYVSGPSLSYSDDQSQSMSSTNLLREDQELFELRKNGFTPVPASEKKFEVLMKK